MLPQGFQARSSLSITLSVWRALLLREALTRISGGRAPWAWLLLEPVIHMAFMVTMLTAVRATVMSGIDAVVFIISGMLAFFMFRRTGSQGMGAVGANLALFTYRQVRPVDTVLVRAFLEGLLMFMVSVIVFSGAALFGIPVLPADPLAVIEAVFGLWLFGLGFGLLFSVPNELIPEFGLILKFIMMPMYLISGVIFPIARVPPPYREWLFYNPVAHGLEATRLGFSSYYHAVPELDLGYLYACAIVFIFFGLVFHLRFAQRMIAK